MVPGDPESGAFHVLDRRTGTWLWIDFEGARDGGYTIADFDLIVREYDFVSLVERPGLLRANAGGLLEAGKPAEMAAISG
ncbi:MAG: hypothetical protein WCB11_04275 [Terriglobales bacterium]